MNRSRSSLCAATLATLLAASPEAFGFAGSEGASFLDIPVGGRPAGLGSAYSSLATDSHAAVWNPAGLGNLSQAEASVMHLSYLEGMSYESLGLAAPVGKAHGVGGTLQYFRAGSLSATDASGGSAGDFGGYFLSASLGYGRRLLPGLSVGAAGRLITAQIAGVGASAFAADLGALARPASRLRLSAVVANLGSGLRFLDESDPLPTQLRLGSALIVTRSVLVALEGVRAFRSDDSVHAGVEWRPVEPLAVRAGYRSDVTREAGSLSGVTFGTGLYWGGYSLDYAWVPLGDLGQAQYFSLGVRFGPVSDEAQKIDGGPIIVLP
ncbi:MAG: PorV/PorQ family protein [Elusimicrobia bacterium]|nr:PorV/PorQ family protein [Elusimicrobiota bacterium]